jgi:hypothetical protein
MYAYRTLGFEVAGCGMMSSEIEAFHSKLSFKRKNYHHVLKRVCVARQPKGCACLEV